MRPGTRSRDHPDRLRPRPDQRRGPRPTSTSSGPGPSPAACGRGATAVLRVKDEARGLPLGAAAAAPRLRPRAARRQRLDRRHPARWPPRRGRAAGLADKFTQDGVPLRGRARRRRAPRASRAIGALAGLLLQLVLRPGPHPLLVEVGRRHGPHHRGRGVDRRPRLAGRRRASRSSGCRATASTSRASRKGYLDLGLRNAEEWGFPIGPDFVFTKAYEWEIRTTPDRVALDRRCRTGLCVELKYLDGDEFAHWTDPASFATSLSATSASAASGRSTTPSTTAQVLPTACIEITAPEGVHVVDHVTHAWLPRAPRPFVVDDPDHARLHLRA